MLCSLVANSSDHMVNIPGEMNPHQVAVHPRPERWVAAGWRSPIDGKVNVQPRVRHAHPGCGNGVSWSLEVRHGSHRRVLQSGECNLGASSSPSRWRPRNSPGGSGLADRRAAKRRAQLRSTEIDLPINEVDGEIAYLVARGRLCRFDLRGQPSRRQSRERRRVALLHRHDRRQRVSARHSRGSLVASGSKATMKHRPANWLSNSRRC